MIQETRVICRHYVSPAPESGVVPDLLPCDFREALNEIFREPAIETLAVFPHSCTSGDEFGSEDAEAVDRALAQFGFHQQHCSSLTPSHSISHVDQKAERKPQENDEQEREPTDLYVEASRGARDDEEFHM